MSGNKIVLDSNIIIYLSKGLLRIEDISERYDDFYISIITYMEVMGYQFSDDRERQIIKEFFDNFEIIYINSEIAENVILIRQQKKIKLPDAIILATAKFLNCPLMTRNVEDFQDILEEVDIVNPLEEPQTEVEEEEEISPTQTG
ncbi:MAG: type II toxin-antitoxin system VapC family toxin [Candidatus Aminicenantes bacterium]|nr:MAG: type II toxin-antitoxin system VapC family toxin [Candidatus Aminicenantes bacterium]